MSACYCTGWTREISSPSTNVCTAKAEDGTNYTTDFDLTYSRVG